MCIKGTWQKIKNTSDVTTCGELIFFRKACDKNLMIFRFASVLEMNTSKNAALQWLDCILLKPQEKYFLMIFIDTQLKINASRLKNRQSDGNIGETSFIYSVCFRQNRLDHLVQARFGWFCLYFYIFPSSQRRARQWLIEHCFVWNTCFLGMYDFNSCILSQVFLEKFSAKKSFSNYFDDIYVAFDKKNKILSVDPEKCYVICNYSHNYILEFTNYPWSSHDSLNFSSFRLKMCSLTCLEIFKGSSSNKIHSVALKLVEKTNKQTTSSSRTVQKKKTEPAGCFNRKKFLPSVNNVNNYIRRWSRCDARLFTTFTKLKLSNKL